MQNLAATPAMRLFSANKSSRPLTRLSWSSEAKKAARQWSTVWAARERHNLEDDSQRDWGWYSRHYDDYEDAESVTDFSPRLYHGNFPEWLEAIERKLREHGLWLRVKRALPGYVHLTAERREELERDDIWTVNIILDSLAEDFSNSITIKRPVTGNELLQKLEQAAKPFRLMDLPRELRDKVFEEIVVVPDDERWLHRSSRQLMSFKEAKNHMKGDGFEFRRVTKMALQSSVGNEPLYIQHPPLLETSRQVREEAGALYWGKNAWQVELDAKMEDEWKFEGFFDKKLQTTMLQFQQWVSTMVLVN